MFIYYYYYLVVLKVKNCFLRKSAIFSLMPKNKTIKKLLKK